MPAQPANPALLSDVHSDMKSAMTLSRRDLRLLFPALLVSENSRASDAVLGSNVYQFGDLTVRRNGENASRPVFDGQLHSGMPIELHETELAPGMMPHPAHHHPHEEMVLMREGTLEVTIGGQSWRIGPGSVAHVAPHEEHGFRNVGTTRAQYFLLALGAKR